LVFFQKDSSRGVVTAVVVPNARCFWSMAPVGMFIPPSDLIVTTKKIVRIYAISTRFLCGNYTDASKPCQQKIGCQALLNMASSTPVFTQEARGRKG
jgi:hypothetical protein